MTLLDIYNIAKDNSGLTLVSFLIILKLVDISKIPINPWKWLLTTFRKITLGDLPEKVAQIETKLDSHIAEEDERDLRVRRDTIMDFASAISSGRNYTKEQFEQMIKECDSYTQYCHDKNFINSVADGSIGLIKQTYNTHLATNTFLPTV